MAQGSRFVAPRFNGPGIFDPRVPGQAWPPPTQTAAPGMPIRPYIMGNPSEDLKLTGPDWPAQPGVGGCCGGMGSEAVTQGEPVGQGGAPLGKMGLVAPLVVTLGVISAVVFFSHRYLK
jgi:hypothetical protein